MAIASPVAFRVALVSLAFAVLADQITKLVMVEIIDPAQPIALLPVLNLRLGLNTGISFGLFAKSLADAVWLIVLIKVAIVALLLWWAARTLHRAEGIGLGLIIGGAIGNALDRLRLGGVVDFIDLHYKDWHWPTFNVADIAISSGVGLLLLVGFLPQRAAAST